MSELIDRERFSADMRDFQNRVGIWRDEAEDTETRTRADAALATIIETKLILDKQPPTASPWHRVEDELPEKEGDYLVWTMLYGGHAYTDYYTPKYGWDEYKVIAWMPLPEPPKEDA